ncbi:type VI secretion system baseplate subunit TssE [Arenibaculum pallidiluteum]|uniref:type VI secretion system baseplate subunit TssE n=1 Tax=Arenibaculum pallidiluteum TaxID=2812559 RepID=UPI001A9654B4|nr:type VI secretion system baseplate subunit TssE [Arenibaculum pallidiluteum]
MSQSSYRDLVQPSLLDRLTDEGGSPGDGGRVFSLPRLREVILRDMTWLLNTTPIGTTVDLEAFPEVATSVLNYGVRSLTGLGGETVDRADFERSMEETLAIFEPRLVHGITVRLLSSGRSDMSLSFTIEADLWAQPVPLRLRMRTEVDRDLNIIRIVENRTEVL